MTGTTDDDSKLAKTARKSESYTRSLQDAGEGYFVEVGVFSHGPGTSLRAEKASG